MLGELCKGDHRHVDLLDGRAKEAAKYSPGLCKAICRGTRKQIKRDYEDKRWSSIEEDDFMNLEILNVDEDDGMTTQDDMKGGPLDVKKVIKARALEMKFVKDRKVYRYSTMDECRKVADHDWWHKSTARVRYKQSSPGHHHLNH